MFGRQPLNKHFWKVFCQDIYNEIFRKFSLSVAMATTQIKWFGLKWFLSWRTTQQPFLYTFCQNICNEIAINASFHFSQCKSIKTLSCHSNQSAWVTPIKNIFFVEANAMNNSAKFQLYPPYGFSGVDFLIFFRKFSLFVAMDTNQIERFGLKWDVW